MFRRRERKRSQEAREKEGKTESKENGNEAEGKGEDRRIRGEENRKAASNAAVVSVSRVPPSGRPDWPARQPSLWETTRILLVTFRAKTKKWSTVSCQRWS